MAKRPSIKVLPLLFYKYQKGEGFFAKHMNERYDYELRHYYREWSPIFDRDGIYYNRRTGVCWFETNGKAYVCDKKDFFNALAGYEALEHDIQTYRLLKALYDYKLDLLSAWQLKFVKRYKEELKIRDTKRRSLKRMVMFKRRLGYWSGE